MDKTKEPKKVFLNIVSELREMIEIDGLIAGDKIPSERELSERLQVGRSSVREALRALELLGLIETRRGEGTFIRDFRDHQLVQLLGTFILKEKQAQTDVFETKVFLEMEAIRQTIKKAQHNDLIILKETIDKTNFTDDLFFEELMRLSENRLTMKIWLILKEYYNSVSKNKLVTSKELYYKIIDAIIYNNYEKAKQVYCDELRKIN